jgi:uncharacterized damage-inducible protein DinB
MITNKQLTEAFERNVRIVQMQTKGLSQADSLLQMPFRANCMNWVLGHIMVNRDSILKSLGEQPLLNDQEIEIYDSESKPVIEEGAGLIPLEKMLDMLKRGQERIAACLAELAPEEFTKEIKVGDEMRTLGERLFFLYFHETYHVGQTEYLRQLAGKDDKVI